MKKMLAALCLGLAGGAGSPSAAVAQQPPSLSKEAREFVTVDAPTIALKHVRVIDGTGGAAAEDQTLVISSGRIAGMGPSASAAIPEGA